MTIPQILAAYLKAWPNSGIDTEGLAFYAKVLQSDYSPDEVAYAMHKLVKTNKFFPAISEIISVISARKREIGMSRLIPDYRKMSPKQIQVAVSGNEDKRKLLEKGADGDDDYWGIIQKPVEHGE